MKLIVGLGNIGKEFEHTNHNAGFEVLDLVAEKFDFKFNKRGCDADFAEVNLSGEKIIFAKPRTFMNDSGLSVKSFVKKYKIDLENVLVISDDIDLDPGVIRIRKSGSAGTHNGLRSIVSELGSENFSRVRIGIGKKHENQDLANFVLSKMHMSDSQVEGLQMGADAVSDFASGENIEKIMAKYNGSASSSGKHNHT